MLDYDDTESTLAEDLWLRDTQRIVYIGTSTESPQTITDFSKDDVLRFVDDVNSNDCIRGSVAQIDYNEFVRELDLDPLGQYTLDAVFD